LILLCEPHETKVTLCGQSAEFIDVMVDSTCS